MSYQRLAAIEQFAIRRIATVRSWGWPYANAALDDGWVPTLVADAGMDHRQVTLERDGFKLHLVGAFDCRRIMAWGPDGLAVTPPDPYDWPKFALGTRVCDFCGQTDVETSRVAFANRSCSKCLSVARLKLETPGWAD